MPVWSNGAKGAIVPIKAPESAFCDVTSMAMSIATVGAALAAPSPGAPVYQSVADAPVAIAIRRAKERGNSTRIVSPFHCFAPTPQMRQAPPAAIYLSRGVRFTEPRSLNCIVNMAKGY